MFLALSVYFIGFWVRAGQTLAMKTWHLRLVRQDGHPLLPTQAAARYLASWLWFLPPLAVIWFAQWHQSRQVATALGVWIAAYAALSWLLPRRQYLHDVLCKTAVIDTRPLTARP